MADLGNKERKAYLEKQKLISCGRCRYHKGENATPTPKPDKYKNINRNSLRKSTKVKA
jgi:hypothetical protein